MTTKIAMPIYLLLKNFNISQDRVCKSFLVLKTLFFMCKMNIFLRQYANYQLSKFAITGLLITYC